jgi:rod shape-determining protein MreD
MNRYILVIVTNIFIALFQTSFLNELLGPSLNFNLLLAFSFSLLLLNEDDLSLFSAFTGGLMLDMLSFNIIGSYTIVFILALYISYLIKRYFINNFAFQLFLTFIFSIVFKMFQLFLNDGGIPVLSILLLLSYFGTTLIAVAFYLLNSYVKERLLKHEYKLN